MQVLNTEEFEQKNVLLGQQTKVSKFAVTDDPVLMSTLSTNFYSNPLRTMIQEIMFNAWDAQKKADPNQPIHIHINETTGLVIRDFGSGIDPDELELIYCTYGHSTKRDEETQTGGFGLGSKSPFAYSSTFNVTNRHNGSQTIVMMNRASEEHGGGPTMTTIVQTPTEEKGLTVTIPLKKEDYTKALSYIQELLADSGIYAKVIYMDMPPKIYESDELQPNEWRFIQLNQYYHHLTSFFAVLGGVKYEIPSHDDLIEVKKNLSTYFESDQLLIRFEPGTITPLPNREGLNMNPKTVRNILSKLETLLETLEENATKTYDHLVMQFPAFFFSKYELCQYNVEYYYYNFADLFQTVNMSVLLNDFVSYLKDKPLEGIDNWDNYVSWFCQNLNRLATSHREYFHVNWQKLYVQFCKTVNNGKPHSWLRKAFFALSSKQLRKNTISSYSDNGWQKYNTFYHELLDAKMNISYRLFHQITEDNKILFTLPYMGKVPIDKLSYNQRKQITMSNNEYKLKVTKRHPHKIFYKTRRNHVKSVQYELPVPILIIAKTLNDAKLVIQNEPVLTEFMKKYYDFDSCELPTMIINKQRHYEDVIDKAKAQGFVVFTADAYRPEPEPKPNTSTSGPKKTKTTEPTKWLIATHDNYYYSRDAGKPTFSEKPKFFMSITHSVLNTDYMRYNNRDLWTLLDKFQEAHPKDPLVFNFNKRSIPTLEKAGMIEIGKYLEDRVRALLAHKQIMHRFFWQEYIHGNFPNLDYLKGVSQYMHLLKLYEKPSLDFDMHLLRPGLKNSSYGLREYGFPAIGTWVQSEMKAKYNSWIEEQDFTELKELNQIMNIIDVSDFRRFTSHLDANEQEQAYTNLIEHLKAIPKEVNP